MHWRNEKLAITLFALLYQVLCRTDCNTSLVTNKLLVLCVTLGCHVSRHANTLIVTIIAHYLYYLEKYPGIRL